MVRLLPTSQAATNKNFTIKYEEYNMVQSYSLNTQNPNTPNNSFKQISKNGKILYSIRKHRSLSHSPNIQHKPINQSNTYIYNIFFSNLTRTRSPISCELQRTNGFDYYFAVHNKRKSSTCFFPSNMTLIQAIHLLTGCQVAFVALHASSFDWLDFRPGFMRGVVKSGIPSVF